MRGSVQVLPAVLLLAVVFSGCVGGDDAPAPAAEPDVSETAEAAEVTAETGSVKGKVLTFELDEVAGASVALVKGADIVSDTKTAKDGTFTFNNVEPGEYLVQVSAICCKSTAKKIQVKADAVTPADLQVERLVFKESYLESDMWKGFIACGAGTPVITVAVCSVAEDPNDDFLHTFNVTEGLDTLVVAMTWDPSAGISGDKLMLIVERCSLEGCGKTVRYARVAGPPPIILSFDDESVRNPELQFGNMTEERTFRLRVFTPFEASVTYQQPFQVYMHEFYHGPPAEDFTPIPDE